MDAAKQEAANRIRSSGLLLIAGIFLIFSALDASASPPEPQILCTAPKVSVGQLYRDHPAPRLFDSLLLPSQDLGAELRCLAVTQPSTAVTVEPSLFHFSHTLSNLVRFEERAQYSEGLTHDQEFILKISDGVEVLARHLDWKGTLVKLLLDSQGRPYPPELLEAASQKEELILRVGDVASLAAKVDFMTNLMQYLAQNLMASDVPLPTTQDEITLVFNINGELADVNVATVLQGATDTPASGGLDINQITVKISNGTITSQAEFDPADFSITEGQFEVKFRLGSNYISSTTTFTKGEGLEKEILMITAQLGALNVTGQATFGAGLPEFKLEASLAGLLSFSTLLTPEGFSQPTFGVELRF